MNNSIYSF